MQAMSAIEIQHRRCSRLTSWMGFDAGHVSNRNRTGGPHNSLPGWDLMQAMSAIEIKHRRSSQLTVWMGFDAGNVSNRNRAQEALATHSLDGI